MISALFSEEPVNTGRQQELDIAKGLAVVFMILIHVQQYFASEPVQESMVGEIIDFLGGIPAAPVFMFMLGAGVVYSRRSTPEVLIKRGLLLIAAGYLLNIARGTLPALFMWGTGSGDYYVYQAVSSTFSIDIFQFAGLAFIFFGCIKYGNLRDLWMLFITLGFCVVNYPLSTISVTDPLQKIITGLFWGSGDISYFPFFSWIFYPVAGYFFAQALIKCRDTSRLYMIVFCSSFLVLLITWFLSTTFQVDVGLASEYSYYHHSLPANILFTAFITMWVSILYFLSKGLPGFLKIIFDRWSRNVSEMYVIQWILIGWFVTLIGDNSLTLPYFIEITVIILILTDLLSRQFKVPI